jgi:hypothetical protein
MNRPPLEVADIVRCAGQSFVERSRKWINGQHEKVLLAITRCRTAALGGHRDQCSDCGHTAISYNSCRNRHCPKCQGNARLRWLQARERELLPTSYVNVVFTLPRELAPLALRRNHAGCRTPLRRATSPPLSASSQPVRRMNPHLQPRIPLVLRRAHCFSVSHLSECSMVVRFRLSDAPPHAHSLCYPLLKPKRSDRNGKLANDQDPLIQIQIP